MVFMPLCHPSAPARPPIAARIDAVGHNQQGTVASSELRAIIEGTVAGVFDIDVELLRQPTRGRAHVALARQVAMYLAHVGFGLSLTEVGQLFERDRTTVAHACAVVEQRRDDVQFDAAIQLLDLVVRILNGTRRAQQSLISAVSCLAPPTLAPHSLVSDSLASASLAPLPTA